ncbi:MAG TPA: NAD(P)-dependent alcohol dehydrogenase, partial [Steroidobacteraceae bacterium]|nr:NAD(P)-dependent alcohol dehydrogenase [Steroidobacteraceae bacterium]
IVLLLLAIAVIGLVVAYYMDSPPHTRPLPADHSRWMKAAVYREYGSPDVIRLEDAARPDMEDDQVLVRVHAASVNPLDWHYMRGTPYVMRPEVGLRYPSDTRLGVDFAGTVEAVGPKVTRFHLGDEVFGGKTGAFAEYVSVRESRAIALKPTNISFEQAAAVPIAALTALQALRDKAHIRPGQQVLINGASGGVGTFAVQIAKVLGAQVTAVCSTRNVEMVRALGADRVIDYTNEDYTGDIKRYDVIFDTVGNHPLTENRRAMKDDGIFIIVGGPNDGQWIGPLISPVKAYFLSPFVSQKFLMFLADLNARDLEVMRDLMQSGKVTPVIDRRYALKDLPEAIRYLELGHARGKVVIDVDAPAPGSPAGNP